MIKKLQFDYAYTGLLSNPVYFALNRIAAKVDELVSARAPLESHTHETEHGDHVDEPIVPEGHVDKNLRVVDLAVPQSYKCHKCGEQARYVIPEYTIRDNIVSTVDMKGLCQACSQPKRTRLELIKLWRADVENGDGKEWTDLLIRCAENLVARGNMTKENMDEVCDESLSILRELTEKA